MILLMLVESCVGAIGGGGTLKFGGGTLRSMGRRRE